MQPMERQRGKSGMRPNLWVKCMMDRTPTVSNLKSTTAAVRTAARTTAAMGDARKNVSFEIAVATGSIDSMQDMAEAFTRKIELEKRRGEDLRNRLKVLLGKLSESRKLAPMAVDPESLRQQTAKLHSLEHRLNKLTEKQNRGETSNIALRNEVDDYRRKKLQQRRLRSSMETDIVKSKRVLVSTLQSLRQAVATRDKAQRDMQALQLTIQKESEEFEKDYKQKVEELTSEKPPSLAEVEKRVLFDEGGIPSATATSSAATLRKGGGGGGMSTLRLTTATRSAEEAEGMNIRHKSTRTCWEIARQEVELRKQSEQLARYTEAFKKIQSDTGISTVEDMSSEFLFAEERNFSLINMINDLNKEVEALESENAVMKAAVASVAETGRQTEASKSLVFRGLDAQVLDVERKTQVYRRKHEQTAAFVDALKPHLISVLQKVLPQTSGSDQLNEGSITEGNIMTYMAVLEHRITELVQMVHASKVGYSLTQGVNTGTQPSVEAQQLLSKVLASSVTIASKSTTTTAVPVKLPSIGDSDSDEESITFGGGAPASFRPTTIRPVSLEHLKYNANKMLERKRARLVAATNAAMSPFAL